jgi:hypothetical protein
MSAQRLTVAAPGFCCQVVTLGPCTTAEANWRSSAWWCEMTLYLTVRVVLNTAAYNAEVDFWIGSMGARRVGAWDRGLDDRGVLLELRPATVIEVIDQAAQNTGATVVGTVLACQVVSPEVVDDRYQSMVTDLGAAAVLTPLGDRAWGHRSI